MAVEPGWYAYQDDREGTVRRWNGTEWIGYPTTPPPAAESDPTAQEFFSSGATSSLRRPFRNQHRLLPYAVLAGIGLIASAATAADVILELPEALEPTADLISSTEITAPALTDPVNNPSTRRLLIALFGGGALFLVWLWRAHRNTGMSLFRPIRSTGWAFIRLILWPFFCCIGLDTWPRGTNHGTTC